MTERKWTKGPWVVGSNGEIFASGENIADAWGIDGCDADIIPQDANAHLIAAAPDLYEALEELLRYEPQGVVECRGDKCREPWCASCFGWDDAELHIEKVDSHFKSARAALAKARGEK